MKNILIVLLFLLVPDQLLHGQNGDHILFKDGSIVEGQVEIIEKLFGSRRVIFNDSVRYNLWDIEAFQENGGYYRRVSTTPFSKNDFAKRVVKGNIDLYEILKFDSYGPNSFHSTMSYNSYGGNSVVSMQFFSKDYGPLQKVNARNLKKALNDNPVSMEYLKKRDTMTMIQVFGSIVGASLIVSSISKLVSLEEDEPYSPIGLLAGGVVINGSIWLPHFQKQSLTRKAVTNYNNPSGSNDRWWEK